MIGCGSCSGSGSVPDSDSGSGFCCGSFCFLPGSGFDIDIDFNSGSGFDIDIDFNSGSGCGSSILF